MTTFPEECHGRLGSVVGFFLAAVFLTAAMVNQASAQETDSKPEHCYEPVEGEWYIENRVLVPGLDERQLDGTVELTLSKAADGVYNGTGLLDVLVPTPVYDIPVTLAALFDSEACVLSGIIYAKPLNASMIFRWDSIGSQASGPYLLKVNGALVSTVPGLNLAKYVV